MGIYSLSLLGKNGETETIAISQILTGKKLEEANKNYEIEVKKYEAKPQKVKKTESVVRKVMLTTPALYNFDRVALKNYQEMNILFTEGSSSNTNLLNNNTAAKNNIDFAFYLAFEDDMTIKFFVRNNQSTIFLKNSPQTNHKIVVIFENDEVAVCNSQEVNALFVAGANKNLFLQRKKVNSLEELDRLIEKS